MEGFLDGVPEAFHYGFVIADAELGESDGETVPGGKGEFEPLVRGEAGVGAEAAGDDEDVDGEFEETVAADEGRGEVGTALKGS